MNQVISKNPRGRETIEFVDRTQFVVAASQNARLAFQSVPLYTCLHVGKAGVKSASQPPHIRQTSDWP
jgi:hypothetical protein